MLNIQGIVKSFGKEEILHGISFSMQEGSTLSVLGKSGCGKTTLLRILAGLEMADRGSFYSDGQDLFALPPQKRGVVYLSQFPLLFPHLTVFENIAFGLRLRKAPEAEVHKQVDAILAQIGLSDQASKKPAQLSGGQQQRVSFARGIVIQPKVLLLDEPFASLDSQTRAEMQQLFLSLREAHRITSLFVTHDLKEALLMGSQMGRMENGTLHVYPSVEAFVESPNSGVAQEIEFWKRFS